MLNYAKEPGGSVAVSNGLVTSACFRSFVMLVEMVSGVHPRNWEL